MVSKPIPWRALASSRASSLYSSLPGAASGGAPSPQKAPPALTKGASLSQVLARAPSSDVLLLRGGAPPSPVVKVASLSSLQVDDSKAQTHQRYASAPHAGTPRLAFTRLPPRPPQAAHLHVQLYLLSVCHVLAPAGQADACEAGDLATTPRFAEGGGAGEWYRQLKASKRARDGAQSGRASVSAAAGRWRIEPNLRLDTTGRTRTSLRSTAGQSARCRRRRRSVAACHPTRTIPLCRIEAVHLTVTGLPKFQSSMYASQLSLRTHRLSYRRAAHPRIVRCRLSAHPRPDPRNAHPAACL